MIVDEEGRIERFLEKPGWGQVFSDTINTGIYVIEPEVLDYIPDDTSYDFSHELFPHLFELRKPLYGVLAEGYWQDIGSLEQYLQANRDALDGRIQLQMPGVRLRGNVWVGQGVSLDSLSKVQGPALIGNYAKIDPTAVIGAHTVLGNNAVLKAGAQVSGSVLGENCYLGPGTRVRGAILGNSVDLRANAVVSDGAAIGDQCSIGENAIVGNNVKIYPFKTIDPGSAVKSSVIAESRGTSSLFGKNGVRGLINVDITPERAMRLAMSYGTLLSKDSFVTTSRDAHPASRVLKRALIAGLNSTGVSVRDLRVAPSAVNRFDLKSGNAAGGIHVRINPQDPEEVEILFAEPPGVPIDTKTERKIENYYHREDFRRAFYDEMGNIIFPPRVVEQYLGTLLETWDIRRIRARRLRIVVDYARSAASILLTSILDRLGVEVMTINTLGDSDASEVFEQNVPAAVERVRRMVASMEADVGLLFDPAGEHLIALDERGEVVPEETLLLLLLRHACREEGPGTVALPLPITGQAEVVASQCGATVRRTKSSDAALMADATRPHTIFAATLSGGFIFPSFLPSMDALFAFGKILELLASSEASFSVIAAEMPAVHLLHRVVGCPWHAKGSVMRLMVEELKHEAPSLVDGIKVSKENGRAWVQILPDADDPIFHIYAEGRSAEEAQDLLDRYQLRLEAVVQNQQHAEE